MNDTSIGVCGGQVDGKEIINPTPFDLSSNSNLEESFDSSPALSNFSNISHFNAVVISSSKSPHSTSRSTVLILCSIAVVVVAGLWLSAGYFIRELVPIYNAPAMLTYLSVVSLQFYFFLIPMKPKLPSRRPDDGSSIGGGLGHESDLALDTYTNREAFKIAGYLFLLFTLSIGLIIKGLSMFPHSSYCGCVGLLAILALIFMLLGMKTESITRYKLVSISLMTVSAILTIFEPILLEGVEIYSIINYGVGLAFSGIMLLALFFVIFMHQIEHTQIHKPLLLSFIGLFSMLVMWLGFIPLHIFQFEEVKLPPPNDKIYWYIVGVVLFGTTIPVYLIQLVLTKTSTLFVCVLLGSIIPLYGIIDSVSLLEFNWINLIASILSVASIITINYKFK